MLNNLNLDANRVKLCVLLALLFATTNTSAQSQNTARDRQRMTHLRQLSDALIPLHQKMRPVQPGDWLASHNEKGQTFTRYVRSNPITLTATRNVLYVLPMGEFDEERHKIVELSAEFLSIYFNCRVETLDSLAIDDVVPADARRVHPEWGMPQIRSTYVLEKMLPARVPKDAVALICFTTSDLYPDDDWNFVFGQATYRDRVGVWSLYRNGDPESNFQLCLKRTLRIATHETGHMFSVSHCTAYECNMCGSNSLSESDRRPLYLCPNCVAKIIWSTNSDPVERFEKLLGFCQKHELDDEAEYYANALKATRR
ncbi:archaemetzincin [Rhodopirellula sp. SWK7]|uniref:archaemetzincin n=1 Tax=Rhodopirellula sp. SWK7 TaxID=595460 RepID=UPI0002BE601B|nr:archaemetzincin [Rhodopirellula sp. SWK7]EMI42094.1 Peptidase M54, archaemetzincin [Rhodopirellula sp. SWK7]